MNFTHDEPCRGGRRAYAPSLENLQDLHEGICIVLAHQPPAALVCFALTVHFFAQMLLDRGYTVDHVNITLDEFKARFGDQPVFVEPCP